MKKFLALVCTLCLLLTAVSRTTLPTLTLPLLVLLGLVLHAPIAIFCFIMATESALKVPFGLHRIRGGKWIHDVTQDLNA